LELFKKLSNTLVNLDLLSEGEIEKKRRIIDAIYPQKFELKKGSIEYSRQMKIRHYLFD
jgi:hypothetical protein